MEKLANTPEGRLGLHALYRRLRRVGEDEYMIRRALDTRPLEENVKTAKAFLRLHTRQASICERRCALRFFNIPAKVSLSVQSRVVGVQLYRLRLQMRSVAALSDALMIAFLVAIAFVLYQMYVICRVGLNQADDRFNLLAIPVLQTITALEEAEVRRREMKKEMEKDVVATRR
jgi:hypothetical protein